MVNVHLDITTKSKMNQKAYSVLLCALLASTFAHELSAKGVAPKVSSLLKTFKKEEAAEVCELECPHSEAPFDCGLTVQVIKDTLVITNQSANAALLINSDAHLVVLLNGVSGGGVALDLEAQKGAYIKSGLWVASKGSLEVFIESVLSNGHEAISNMSGCVKFTFESASNEVLKCMNEIVCKLVANIEGDLKADAKLGLQIIVAIGGGIVSLFNGVLKGSHKLCSGGVLHISYDIAGFFNVLKGFSVVIEKSCGSLQSAIEAGVSFNMKAIFGAAHGLEALSNLLLQLGSKIDIRAALKKHLNDAECFFELVAQMGGNVAIGISGLFLAASKIVALTNKKIGVEVAINVIVQYVAYSSQHVTEDLTETLHDSMEGFVLVLERIKAKSSCKELMSIITKLCEGKLIIGGVNISIIVEKLVKDVKVGASNLLVVVAFIVLQLKAVVETSISVPYLLLILISKLNTAAGVDQLIALGIKIDVSIGSSTGGILKSILHNGISVITNLATGKFYNALVKLPVIGTIVKSLDVAIESASNGKVSLKENLNASPLAKNLILGLIQTTSGIYLGVQKSEISKVKTVLEKTCSTSATINVNISHSTSASFSG